MGLALIAARLYLPKAPRKRKLEELFRAAADAFNCPVPHLGDCSTEEMLEKFAVFTRENAITAIQNGTTSELKERLYFQAQLIGRNLREELKIRTFRETMMACQLIYKALKIEFRGDSQGQIRINRCYFSRYYSGKVCRIISSLDEGLAAGLSGGLKLEFTQRITEGSACCRAQLRGRDGSR
jgi:hypothetical protein